MARQLWWVVAGVVALLACTRTQEVPASPCPAIFRYEIGSTGSWEGVLQVPPPQPKSSLRVDVVMAIKAALPTKYAGKLGLVGDKDDVARGIMRGDQREIQYRVLFPLENPLPIMRSVTANDNVICSGPNVRAPLVTTISLEHTLYPLVVVPSATGGFNYPYPQPPSRPTFEVPQPSKPEWPVEIEVFESVPQALPSPRPRPPNVAPIPRPTDPPPPPPSNTRHDQCGRATLVSHLVANGQPSKRGEWPWLGALFRYNNNGGVDYICSSTLINDRHVVTAAHCLQKDEEELPPEGVVVYLGKYNLRSQSETDSRAMEIKAVFVHEDYVQNKITADIAVLQFKRRVTFSLYIRPICLWNQSPDINPWIGQLGTVVGWGRDEKGNNITPEPRMVKVPIVSYETCVSSRDDFVYFTSNRTFCAGARDGSGPCNGDSGSGFVLPVGDSWYLRGIVSLSLRAKGTVACNLNEYIVYTDVAKFQDWLQRYMIQ